DNWQEVCSFSPAKQVLQATCTENLYPDENILRHLQTVRRVQTAGSLHDILFLGLASSAFPHYAHPQECFDYPEPWDQTPFFPETSQPHYPLQSFPQSSGPFR